MLAVALVAVPARAQGDDAARGAALLVRADALASDHKFREALEPAEQALALYERAFGPDHCELVQPLLLVGNMRREAGNIRGAIEPTRRALAICEREFGEVNFDTTVAMNNLAVLHRLLGEYGKAIPLYERVIAARERLFDSESEIVAEALTNFAIVLIAVGDFATAEALLRRSAAIIERVFGPDSYHTGLPIGVLGNLRAQVGDRVEAERLYRRALDIHERSLGLDHRITLTSLTNLAFHYVSIGAYAQAEPLLVKGLEARERVLAPGHSDIANALTNLARLYVVTGDTARARPLLERALAIEERATGADGVGAAGMVSYMASVEMAEGNIDRAEALFARALASFEKQVGPDHHHTATSLASVGAVRMARGDRDGARPYLERALAVRERVLGEDHPATASSRADWAGWLWSAGRVDEAVAAQTRANDGRERELVRNLTVGSEQRKLSYLALTARELDRTLSLHQRAAPSSAVAARTALEVVLRRKGRALDAMARQIEGLRRHATAEDRALLADLSVARAEYARKTLAGARPGEEAAYREEVAALERRIEELEARVADRGAGLRAGALPVTFDAVREGVPDDAVLVEIASFQPFDPEVRRYGARRYAVYTLDRAGRVAWADLGPVAEVDGLVATLRARLRARADERGVRAAARALDERVGRPVRRLVGERVRRLLVSPDGELNLVPFAALVDERGRYLVERYEIIYLTSGRDLLRLRPAERHPEGRAPEVIANPDFGAPAGAPIRFAPLPGTEQEAREISRLLGDAHVLVGPQATEGALKRVAAPAILHIATHGFFLGGAERAVDAQALASWEATREIVQVGNTTPAAPGSVLDTARGPLLRSGLGLAGANRSEGDGGDDGLLTALEATGLDLWGTRLVVLSACDTGVGEVRSGDGVYGLRRALTLAGAEAQLSSLWAVSDRATRELMVAYYGELLAGRGRSEALRRTQLALLGDPRRRHPFYWAGFIPSGAWWPIEKRGHR